MNFTQFLLDYVDKEENKPLSSIQPRFGGHQTLEEREKSFYAQNQTIHCGFVKEPPGFSNTRFKLNEMDKRYMKSCAVVVSSCIFGSSDFLRRPTSKVVYDPCLIKYLCMACLRNWGVETIIILCVETIIILCCSNWMLLFTVSFRAALLPHFLLLISALVGYG